MHELIEKSPLNDREIARHVVSSPAEVAEAIARGRRAFLVWSRESVASRVERLRSLRATIVARLDDVVETIVASTGKPPLDALTGDVYTVLDGLAYHERHACSLLEPQSRPGHVLSPRAEFFVHYEPLGVIGILSPWNYPFQLAMLPLISALAAGNTVDLKPSEVTPSNGKLILDLCSAAGFSQDVVQVVLGGPEVGEALVNSRPDKVFFTGSVSTGKKVMAAAAENLTPLALELGGKDPMIVFSDAAFQRAVNGAVYGAFVNAGQACISIERVYVEAPLYERFVTAVTTAAAALRVGSGRDVDLGPMIRSEQCDVVERHVDDALARGARLTTPRRRERNLLWPLVLRDVSHEMLVMKEETFGPVMPVMPFATEAEAVALANDSAYGLNASVWTENRERAERVATGLVTGNCATNDVLKNVANPHLPFGGERQRGIGRYHGPEGLLSFCRTKSIMHHPGSSRTEMNWFPYRPSSYEIVKSSILAVFGEGSALSKAGAIAKQWLGPSGLWRRRDESGK